jgi:D-amino peptidase
MRIYLSVDMEGLAGVAHPSQVTFGPGTDRTDYDRSRALMAAETNAAIEAAFERGAGDVVVNDSHWQMRNLRAEDLTDGARLLIGDKALSMTHGIGEPGEPPFQGAAFIGYHAGAGNRTGVIAHTYSSATVLELRVNGVPHNEAGINAIRLGHFGVPVMLVAGDDALADEVAAILPWAERVVVKRALGYSTTASLSPRGARTAIREGMTRAIDRLGEMQPYVLPGPLLGELDLRLPVMADYAAILPGVERTGPRTIAFGGEDGDTFFRTFLALMRLSGTSSTT